MVGIIYTKWLEQMTTITAHAELGEELSRQFLIIKKHYGAKNNAEVIRYLIREKYREIEGRVKLKEESTPNHDQELDQAS